jgi:hypothetical protein
VRWMMPEWVYNAPLGRIGGVDNRIGLRERPLPRQGRDPELRRRGGRDRNPRLVGVAHTSSVGAGFIPAREEVKPSAAEGPRGRIDSS